MVEDDFEPLQPIDLRSLPGLLERLYNVVADLEKIVPRPFTPDGHLVGSIGEAVAAYAYNLRLNKVSQKAHDAENVDGIKVQVKLTQRKQIVLSFLCDHLIVLQLDPKVGFTEVYNGPGEPVWEIIKHKDQEGRQRPISLFQLRKLLESQPGPRRAIKQVRPFPELSTKAREAVAE